MKETLKQRIESLIRQLTEREQSIVVSIARAKMNDEFAEAHRLQTRLDVVTHIRHELENALG
jgi:FixJ family two-component response regulator